MKDWSQPVPVDAATMVFPADVIGKYLPEKDEIPKEFWGFHNGNKWSTLTTQWFFKGIDGSKFVAKPGVDRNMALRQLQACLGSFEPKHEHKEAGVAYLMSLFFEDYRE